MKGPRGPGAISRIMKGLFYEAVHSFTRFDGGRDRWQLGSTEHSRGETGLARRIRILWPAGRIWLRLPTILWWILWLPSVLWRLLRSAVLQCLPGLLRRIRLRLWQSRL